MIAPAMSDWTGAERIAMERQRQIDAEGWTPEHDDKYQHGELMDAGLCYIEFATELDVFPFDLCGKSPSINWPWNPEWWKPSPDPIRNLEKAGALIAAEIDRLERAKRIGGGDAD